VKPGVRVRTLSELRALDGSMSDSGTLPLLDTRADSDRSNQWLYALAQLPPLPESWQ
jgi:hypothetical protein